MLSVIFLVLGFLFIIVLIIKAAAPIALFLYLTLLQLYGGWIMADPKLLLFIALLFFLDGDSSDVMGSRCLLIVFLDAHLLLEDTFPDPQLRG